MAVDMFLHITRTFGMCKFDTSQIIVLSLSRQQFQPAWGFRSMAAILVGLLCVFANNVFWIYASNVPCIHQILQQTHSEHSCYLSAIEHASDVVTSKEPFSGRASAARGPPSIGQPVSGDLVTSHYGGDVIRRQMP